MVGRHSSGKVRIVQNQASDTQRKGFLYYRGVLRIVLGAVLFMVFTVFAVIVTLSVIVSLAGGEPGPSLADPGGIVATIFSLYCLGYGAWFLYSGLMLTRVGRATPHGTQGAHSWVKRGLGPLDTGFLLLGIAIFLILGTCASFVDDTIPFPPAEESASMLLFIISTLIAAIGLVWFGVKSARQYGANTGQTEEQVRPNVRSPERLFVLGVCSFSLYAVYWSYKNWEDIKRADSSDIKPFWRTVGTVIPFLGLVIMYKQFKSLYRIAESSGIQPRHSFVLISVSYVTLMLISHLILVWAIVSGIPELGEELELDLANFFIGILTLLPLLSVQETINRTWQTSAPLPVQRQSLSEAETIWVLVGAIGLFAFVLEMLSVF